MADPGAVEWLNLILLGGVMGMVGQGARSVVGLKKLYDEAQGRLAAGEDVSARDLFVGSQLFVSFAIGFIAGVLAAVVLRPQGAVSASQIAGLAAAGYSGSDFIEGFMSRFTPQLPAKQVDGTAPVDAGDAEG